MLLQLENISKYYKESQSTIHAVDGVSLNVAAGEFVTVQGPSGCGKSTLLLTAGGLLKPDSGQAKIEDQDPYILSSDDRAEFRAKHIGFVFQQFHLVPYLSVLENVLAPGLATNAKSELRD
ncbi:MAG: ATP-binding cassette domain-containing protein, partial [Planctomicrobium sp.]|nr:ATP-binding cassette domain-containing protein [Planctomicrobium sp.]